MSEKEKFSIADYIKAAVPEMDTGRKQIEYIDIDLIDEDARNFYTLDGLDELASNIALFGVMDPLIVRSAPDGRVVVTSGHRRRAAVRKLVESGDESRRSVPCIRDDSDASEALQELKLIFANSDTRRMSSADISRQVDRVRELLYQLQEEGYEFPGRMRDHVAEACKISKTKIATLDVISKNLSKSNAIQSAWKKGRLSESTAYALAKLPRELQDEIVDAFKERKGWPNDDLYYLHEHTVTEIEKAIKHLDKMKCDVSKTPCQSCADKKRSHIIKTLLDCDYSQVPCSSTCCEDCINLKSCKDVCPQLLATQKKMKADAAFAAKLEKAKQAEKDAPKIKAIQELWNRFGQARNAADVSVKDAYKAMDIYYSHSDEQETIQKECLEAKFTPESKLPYGYCVTLTEMQRYVKIADKFGVSLDYLFCRTDEPKMAMAGAAPVVPGSDTVPTWQTGTPPDEARFDAVIEIDFEDGHGPARAFAKWHFGCWDAGYGTVTDKVPRWYPLPED